MRYNILLLALLLYNASYHCLAKRVNSTELAIANATVATASTHSDKPPGIKSDKVHDDDDDDGGGGNGDGGNRSRNDNYRPTVVHVYRGKIAGQQTASPTTTTSTKHKQKHNIQSAASRSTYMTTSTTSSVSSHGPQTTATIRRAETPFSTAATSLNNEPNINVSKAAMQPAFAYKAIVPSHEEKNVAISTTMSYNDNIKDSELDGASSKKIIGSSVVTSVSVILNGDEPEFTDALGSKVPKPQLSLQVASPIDLLNPDRYEFYTFDDNGELVKRLMTMQEIQSIVANGDGEGPTIIHTAPIDDRDPEKNVQDIVNSVQTVLNTQVESNKNTTTETLPVLDTPDVSSSWSMILPAIFGNTGGDIFPQQKPAQIIMIPETEIVETSTTIPTTLRTTKKPKPNKRKPGQKRKTSTSTTTEMTPQVVQEELGPHESVYTGIEQYQNIASNVQNFEGIPELNLKPLYQELHDFSTKTETTTRRVFVNNQEIVQMASNTTTTTESPSLGEELAKKPHGSGHRVPPHRHKLPNDGTISHSTRRPQVTHTKQKIKRKPSTTTTTTTTTPATTTTTTSTTTTTTTTTTEAPSPPPTTISPTPPVSTTHKKKKKKPTRQPIAHPIHTAVAHDEQTSTHYTKPHPHGEKRKPSTQKPRPTHPSINTNKPTSTHDQDAESSFHHTTSNKINHHKRPRPHKTTTTTTTTTTEAPPPPLTPSIIETPIGEGIIAEEYPALTLESYVSPNLLNQLKSEATSTSTTTTKPPLAYPVPVYNTNKPKLPIADVMEEMQLKKEKLPSLSMIQQHYQPEIITEQPVTLMTNDDIYALMSFDQLMQSLQGDASNKEAEQNIQTTKKPIIPVKYDSAENMDELQGIANKKKKPVMANILTTQATTKKPIQETTQKENKPLATHKPGIITTVKTPTTHYGGSTLTTMLAEEEDGTTGHPIIPDTSTESASTEDTTFVHTEKESGSIVLITQRPVFFATTHKPEDVPTTYTSIIEESNTESYLQSTPIDTDQPSVQNSITTATAQTNTDQAHVVKFEPLYAEDADPIITELSTTTEAPIETSTYGQNEDTTFSEFTENHQENTDSEQSTESSEGETVYTTQAFLRIPVSIPQKVNDLISEEDSSTENPLGIADLKPHLNSEVLKPTDQILMGDFQTQAATVASTLVDGTNTIAAETFMSSNETKDEIQFLMSDVIQQMANEDQYKLAPPDVSANRLTNFAQLNSSFMMKPALLATNSNKTSNLFVNNVQKPVTIAMDATTKLPYFEESPSSSKYSSESETINYETTTDVPMIMETTTFLPSREELIKIEEEYFDAVKQDEQSFTTVGPIVEEETTTLSIPILSLSQTYDEIIGNNHEKEAQESLDYLTTEKVTTSHLEYQTHSPVVISENADSSENKETLHLENQYDEFHHHKNEEEKPIQSEETSEETSSVENNSFENNYAFMINSGQQQLAVKPNNNFNSNELQKDTEEEYTSELPSFVTTVKDLSNGSTNSIEKQSIEQIFETIINSSNTADELTDIQHSTDMKQSSEDKKPSSLEETTSQSQYATEANKQSDENQQTNYDAQSESIEEQTDLPLPNTELIPESQSNTPSSKYEQSTPAYAMNTETSEEMLDELISAMYNQTGLKDTPEDVYVKLGESTAKPLEQQQKLDTLSHENEDQSTEENLNMSNTTLSDLENLTAVVPTRQEIEETQLKQKITNLSNTEIQLPDSSIKLDSQEQPDAEDDQDQTGYQVPAFITSSTTTSPTKTTTPKSTISSTKRINTLKPVSYYKQPSFGSNNQPEPPKIFIYSTSSPQQRPMQRPAALSNLMASSTQATRPPVKLEPSPDSSKGLEASVANLDEDVLAFAKFCNELAFNYWKTITSEKISSARSLVLSPFALTSMLSMVFLGARGGTSGEMNEVLKLDDVVTFNPHLVFKNITDSVERSMDSDIATAAFVREVFSDRNNGKILQFFKDKTQQFYAGHVEEVNFHVVNDIIRRRTNLLVKRHTMGKVLEYLRTNSVWVNGPLATISANLFQTDCSKASTHDRDGEMFFQVHPTVRQRRLIPIPAVLYKSGFTAGYEKNLDATIAAFGRIQDTVSTIYVMPGHQSSISPTDNLERLQQDLVELAFKENAWSNILTSLMDRPGMEVQLPRFSHRSFVNASLGLQKMGLKGLFKSDYANLRGLTGSSSHDIYLSDMIQINTFSTCGEERISDHHHVEMYPAPPLRKRNKDVDAREDDEYDSSEAIIDFGSLVQDPVVGRGFYDDLLDPKYLELPLPLRPRQARVPDTPRLRFDKPFLYFVRHNPTGMILFMGRFNPRLLP